jgi:hypothetical protein
MPASLDTIVRPGHYLQRAFKYTIVDLTYEPRCLAVMTRTVPAAIPYPVVDLQVPPLWDLVGGQAGSVSLWAYSGWSMGSIVKRMRRGMLRRTEGIFGIRRGET